MPPDNPENVPAPPPPPESSPASPETPQPPARPVAKGPSPLVWLAIGLILGVLAGGAGGYFLFHTSGTGNPTAAHSSPSPTLTFMPSAAPGSSPAETATPTAPAVAAGIVPCPVATPPGQHTLGSPAPASGAEHADPSLDFCAGGNATIPAGTTRFMTGNNWGLGIADSCPAGSAGEGGMNTVLTVSEVLIGGGAGPDTATEPGDWADSGGVLMPNGGNYQLQITTVAPDCVWHIAIYTT